MTERIELEVNERSPTVHLCTDEIDLVEAVSPTVDLERVEGGVRITVEDINGRQTETVYDGAGGGAVLPTDGRVGDILMKTASEGAGVSWVTPADSPEGDNTRPITAAAVYTAIGNIDALLATI